MIKRKGILTGGLKSEHKKRDKRNQVRGVI
jgi:hypothetical protein